MKYQIESIKSIEKLEDFDNEYVYDIEVADDSHTFIANDILVHNSAFLELDEILSSCDWKSVKDPDGEPIYQNELEFILAINKHRLGNYLKKCFEAYAKKWNTDNYQDFELESISKSGIWLAKKKYFLDTIWQDGITNDSLQQLTIKGVELAQSSTPEIARKSLKDLVIFIFQQGKGLDRNDLVGRLRVIKEEFKLADPDKISKGQNINEYEKYVLNDTTGIEVMKGCPMAVRAAANYNFKVNSDSRWKGRYQLIKSGDKVKFYKVKVKMNSTEEDVFAYIPGIYPYEFAPEIYVDLQFEDTVLDPINRVMIAMGQPPILPGLQKVNMISANIEMDIDDDYDPFSI